MPTISQVGCLALVVFASASASAADRPDRVIADFEAKRYAPWKATGDAFGPMPATGSIGKQQPVTGFLGERLVNTFRDGDRSTGTLTSPPFEIDRKYLHFLIGGGNHPQTCLQLLVDGSVVASASGQNDERLTQAFFDVAAHQGKTVQLRIVDNERGQWGHINVDQIVLSDDKPKVFEYKPHSQSFTVGSRYLILPIQNGAELTKVKLVVDGETLWQFNTELASDPSRVDYYAFLVIEAYKGRAAEVSADSATEEGFALAGQADKVPGFEDLYDEALRPQFHYSQKVGWNNDPNGMVYHNGEWHLFYQHNPVGWKWGNMTWGHAVSPDLLHWQQLPNALFPDKSGSMFSGTGIVDKNNTAGFKSGDEDVIVLAYTAAGRFADPPQPYTQGIAYSNDRGRTFTKHEDNPVVGNLSGGRDRDPKLLWHEPTGKWVMVLYLDEGGKRFAFLTSDDLKTWEKQSEIGGFHECPELFELPVDGDEDNTRWVLYDAYTKYMVGQFDGKRFTPEHEGVHSVHHGAFYASQTFNNAPGGRRIQIGWAKIQTPGMPFNQTFSFPLELTLRSTPRGVRMYAEPIKEIEKLRKTRHAAEPQLLTPGKPVELDVDGELFEIRATFEVGAAKHLGLNIGGNIVGYSAHADKLHGAEIKPVDGKITMHVLVDRPMLEVCGNRGEVFITSPRPHKGDVDVIKAFANGGAARLVELEVYELKSIWRSTPDSERTCIFQPSEAHHDTRADEPVLQGHRRFDGGRGDGERVGHDPRVRGTRRKQAGRPDRRLHRQGRQRDRDQSVAQGRSALL